MVKIPKGSYAVQSAKKNRGDTVNLFPTPPWATRALMDRVLRERFFSAPDHLSCWEPAAGLGHMSDVLKEYFGSVYATDAHDHWDGLDAVCDFTAYTTEYPDGRPDWIITNPPFVLAEEFAQEALEIAREGVALLVRLNWIEGVNRYMSLFHPDPPWIVAPFVERVNMCDGRWDPDGTTATAYAWVVWGRPKKPGQPTMLRWIAPGARRSLALSDDSERFAGRRAKGGDQA